MHSNSYYTTMASPLNLITPTTKLMARATTRRKLHVQVANQPVSVAIDDGGLAFEFYVSGVFAGDCGTDLDHGVTAVAYGTKYWLVQNSWGTSWGGEGYIRMERGIDAKEGRYGIAMEASYPTA